ncbi:transcription initiation factor IIA gamma chain (nucleomorph) [Cryptomonas paramecium]|uniref:Transcription initiation factor IIA subunit 2 n=1 Tax=Cryptomonas paramaecium TaxID=2898 RepID=F2HH99_9CRYP|nr:transcription initiation factor IIA gamma chain [Cryptomonas paramecium]AEA38695.1 transcription initiation factor IIA gamma chain [Cryptomonas paramecium]|mmetsp:Transcript_4383/g.12923  ORF Transcript_4383/g.12923 Transcript_4383/m.12923 type:complete len:124 (-) Transcript_4383:3304-3675(-)
MFVHYRLSTIGIQLEETLQELLKKKVINFDIIDFVKNEFDKAIINGLKKYVKDKPLIKGELKHYQNCDNVWIFEINNPQIKVSSYNLPVQFQGILKIIACDLKLTKNLSKKKIQKNPKKLLKI